MATGKRGASDLLLLLLNPVGDVSKLLVGFGHEVVEVRENMLHERCRLQAKCRVRSRADEEARGDGGLKRRCAPQA